MLNVLTGGLDQFTAVPDQGAHCADLRLRPKCRSEQSHGVQKPEPLAFMPVCTPPWHVLHMSSVY